jgi:hypothetical protein
MHSGRVVNIKSGEPYDVYIGWENPRYRLRRSVWRNPYNKEFRDGLITREEAIEKYERYLLEERPDLVERLPELRQKVLACWCVRALSWRCPTEAGGGGALRE